MKNTDKEKETQKVTSRYGEGERGWEGEEEAVGGEGRGGGGTEKCRSNKAHNNKAKKREPNEKWQRRGVQMCFVVFLVTWPSISGYGKKKKTCRLPG